MTQKINGELLVKPEQRFALVIAEFNEFITTRLTESCIECFVRHGGKEAQITQVWVPGSFEIPTAAAQLAKSGKYSAVICLGAVIRGETGHYDQVANAVSRGVADIGPSTGVPTIFGVITADSIEQAIDRAGLKSGNAGWNAACTAIAMANVMAKIAGK